MHRVHASMVLQHSTALLLRLSTSSSGGQAGDDALCSAWSDCRHKLKHVHDPLPEPEADELGVDLDFVGIGLMHGVEDGLGKYFMLAGVEACVGPCDLPYEPKSCGSSAHGVACAVIIDVSNDCDRGSGAVMCVCSVDESAY